MIPKEFETISEYVCKQTRWTDGSIRHDRMEDVVRCKDCIVFGTHGKNTDICPMWHNTHIDPYRDFCSRGVRKTENCSEKPNNSTSSKMEQVDEPQIQLTARCLNCNNAKACKENHWEGCVYEPKDEKTCETCRHWKYIAKEWQCEACKCQGYEPKDEPQTDNGIGCSRCEGRYDCYDRDMPHAVHCNNYGKVTDEPQTDCAWK